MSREKELSFNSGCLYVTSDEKPGDGVRMGAKKGTAVSCVKLMY